MKFLRKFFELKDDGDDHEEVFNTIRDYFSDIVDEQNFREIIHPNERNLVYHVAINYFLRNKITQFKVLSLVDLLKSNINGVFTITFENYAYKIVIKYLRGSLKFPEFGEDIGIFKSRMEDEGFIVLVLRGSETSENGLDRKHIRPITFDNEMYMSILIFKTEEDIKNYRKIEDINDSKA